MMGVLVLDTWPRAGPSVFKAGGQSAWTEIKWPFAVASMKGCSRSYAIAGTPRGGKSALAIAVNDRCDAIVATAIVSHDQPAAGEQVVLDFVSGAIILTGFKPLLGSRLEWPQA
jgi:hypothetical protein